MAIEGPSKAEIKCVDNKDGTCSVSYVPTLAGDYNIIVRYNENHIPGSPFSARITGESHTWTYTLVVSSHSLLTNFIFNKLKELERVNPVI